MRCTIIIPAHNEEKNIRSTIKDIYKSFKYNTANNPPFSLEEVIIVDDGSNDGTVPIIQKMQKQYKTLSLLQNTVNRGKGYSLRRGVTQTCGELIAFLDADGDIAARECRKFFEIFQKRPDIDIIIGSKRLPDSMALNSFSLSRMIIRSIGNILIQFLLVSGIKDTQGGVKAFRAAVLKPLTNSTIVDGWSFDIELLALAQRLGYRIHEEPIAWKETIKTHVNLRAYIQIFIDVVRIFFRIQMKRYSILSS